jgi:glycosyltransferase involved in cell wall biosynthesis
VRIAIASVQVPFVEGGAESLTRGLATALRARGLQVDVVTMPFRFLPAAEVERAMEAWAAEDFARLNGLEPDRVICLKFPAYLLSHPVRRVWLVHQHRPVYDLWKTPWDGGLSGTRGGERLRARIHAADARAFAGCGPVYTIAHEVSRRLQAHNDLASEPLYHPPALADRLYDAESEPYVFFPSRLEGLKRQDLLVRAMALVKSPVAALLAGEGGMAPALQIQIDQLGLRGRVRLLGRISDEEMLVCYARCLATFFGPYSEDYGLVALEAMRASKPVVTCSDSGEPAHFVVDGETGFVVAPEPEAIAGAIDALWGNPSRAAALGRAGRARYDELGVSWDRVVEALLA